MARTAIVVLVVEEDCERVRQVLGSLSEEQRTSCAVRCIACDAHEVVRTTREHRASSSELFVCVLYPRCASDAVLRQQLTRSGANMVTSTVEDVTHVAARVVALQRNRSESASAMKCPICSFATTTEDDLWLHMPMYHINEQNIDTDTCPVCRKGDRQNNMMVHVHNRHGPPGRGEVLSELDVHALPLYAFALVIVRRPSDGYYLLVEEFAGSGYWVPGGRVDGPEALDIAAVRETKEEGGIDIRLTGVLQVQYTTHRSYLRMRVVFMGEPLDEAQAPKGIPDYESVGAVWVEPALLLQSPPPLTLRGSEPVHWARYLDGGGAVYPIDVLAMRER